MSRNYDFVANTSPPYRKSYPDGVDVEVFSFESLKEANKKATELDNLLQPLHSSLFIESNPSPVKYAASLLGMCNPSVRLPLVEIKDETKKKVSAALKRAKLL